MADFFQQEEQAPEAPEVIKLGDVEYKPDELQHLVELGRIGQEAEEKYNTKLDKVWPEFTKTKNDYKTLQQQLEEARQEQTRKAQEVTQPTNQGLDENQKQLLRQALKEVYGDEPMTKAQWQQEQAVQSQANELLKETKTLESEINGSDGRPAFKQAEILEYMRETGIKQPMRAYKDKYEDELDAWKEAKLASKKPQGFSVSQSSSTSKMPTPVKIDKSNLESLLKESLYGGEQE